MSLTTISDYEEAQLSALNAKAHALAIMDASVRDEAVDWGALDYSMLRPWDWRMIMAPELD